MAVLTPPAAVGPLLRVERATSLVTCRLRISNICSDSHWVSDLWCLQSFTSQSTLGDAMICLMQQLPRVQWIITTLGKKGSVLVEKASPQDAQEDAVLQDMLNKMLTEASSSSSKTSSTNGASRHGCVSIDSAACTSKTQVHIRLDTAIVAHSERETALDTVHMSIANITAAGSAAAVSTYLLLEWDHISRACITSCV